jgi:hypothetical protein
LAGRSPAVEGTTARVRVLFHDAVILSASARQGAPQHKIGTHDEKRTNGAILFLHGTKINNFQLKCALQTEQLR